MAILKNFWYWPGLSSAWGRGSARGLLVSVLLAWSIMLLLLGYLVWPGWISGWFLNSLSTAIVVFWLVALVRDKWLESASELLPRHETADTFVAAQSAYLRGDWFEAEAILLELANADPGDMPVGLLLVGVLRRTQRAAAAIRRLDKLCLYDASNSWRFEIEREKRLIEQAAEEKPASVSDPLEGPDVESGDSVSV